MKTYFFGLSEKQNLEEIALELEKIIKEGGLKPMASWGNHSIPPGETRIYDKDKEISIVTNLSKNKLEGNIFGGNLDGVYACNGFASIMSHPNDNKFSRLETKLSSLSKKYICSLV